MLTPVPTPGSAFTLADQSTSEFFEAHPLAYEGTMDHLLLHFLESAIAVMPGTIRYATRFVGGKGQIYPSWRKGAKAKKRIEAIDLVLYLQQPPCPPKAVLLQSKRLFPKRHRSRSPKPSGNLLQDIENFVKSELARPTTNFDPSSYYESLSTAGDQWRAIDEINRLSVAAYNRDAVFYVLYNPWTKALLDPRLTVSSNRFGCRVLTQGSIAKGYAGGKAFPHLFNAAFATTDSEFAQFISTALACGAGVPFGTSRDPGFDILLPGADLGSPPSRDLDNSEGESETEAFEERALEERAERNDRPILDIRKCPSISIFVEPGQSDVDRRP